MFILPSFTTYYLLLWVTVALASFCIKAPAQLSPPPPSLSSCSLLSPHESSWLSKEDPLSNVTFLPDDLGRSLTLFKQTTYTLQANYSISASLSFTASNTTEDLPSLAFILARSPPHGTLPSILQSIEVTFGRLHDPFLPPCLTPFPACSRNLPQQDLDQISASVMYSTRRDDDDDDDEAFVKDELSFTYFADIAELRVQVVHYIPGFQSQLTFNFSTASDVGTFPNSEEPTSFFVGYITSRKPNINVTSTTPQAIISTPPPHIVVSTLGNETNSSTHIKVVPWVLVGIFSMGIFIGFFILGLLIKKRHGRHPPNSSHPIAQGFPPLATRRAPFSPYDLESGETPMMRAPSLPPAVHSNAFQISGTASWLKQPNPR